MNCTREDSPLLVRGSFPSPTQLTSVVLFDQVCTTWNHQVSCGAHFMNKISTYCRQCKEDTENLHKTDSEEPMETMVSPNKRKPLADFTPNSQSQFQTARPACPVSSFTGMPVHQALARGEEQWDSEPQQKTQAVRCHLWHQEEQEKVLQYVNSD